MSCGATAIGELRHRITIETVALAATDSGGQTPTWSTHATVWAKVTAKQGGEMFFANRVEPRTTHEVRIRYLSTLTEKMRVIFEGRVLQIKAILPDEMKSFQTLKCVEDSRT